MLCSPRYTMTKSTTIIFILIFAILLKLEKKTWSLMMIVVMISSGLFLFTYKSTNFNGNYLFKSRIVEVKRLFDDSC